MAAPYFVTVTATDGSGTEWTIIKQRCESKEDWVLFQKALTKGAFELADEDVKRGKESANK